MTKAIHKLKIEDLRQIINEVSVFGDVDADGEPMEAPAPVGRNRYGSAHESGMCPNCGGFGNEVDKNGLGDVAYQCQHCKGVWWADGETRLPKEDWDEDWIDGPEPHLRHLQREAVDHKSINSVVGVASKLLAAVEAFKEKAPPAAINAVTPQLGQLEKTLENMVSTPGSYVPTPKKVPQKVSLKPVKTEGKRPRKTVKEATGDDGMTVVDASNWQHLEVGNTYMCQVGSDNVKATFSGWVDKQGNPTEAENPEEVELRFADVSDGMEWEAYWSDGSYCAGTSTEPLSVEEAW